MGSIHEALQGLQEARDLEARTLKKEKEELERVKREKMANEYLVAQREQYAKLMVLKEKGVFAMIADATCTPEINPEWPLSQEEREERNRQRQEEWKKKLERTTLEKPFSKKEKEELENSVRQIMRTNFSEKGDYWIVDLSQPEVTDSLEWDTNVTINAKKMTERRRIHGNSGYEETDKVTISYDGDALLIMGKEIEYEGFIPSKEDMENAFIRAFDNPGDIRRQPNPWDHTHPELMRF